MVKNALDTRVGCVERCALSLFGLRGDAGSKRSLKIFQGHISQQFPKGQAAFVRRQPRGDSVAGDDGGQWG